MKVTDIRAQAHHHDRVSVYLDKKYAFSLEMTDALQFGLKIGMELTEEDVARMQEQGDFGKARAAALEVIARKAVTKKCLCDMLKKRGYNADIVDAVTSDLFLLGYLDDAAFAIRYAQDAAEIKRHGPLRIAQDLQKKGVQKADIDAAIAAIDFENNGEIQALLTQKFRGADFHDQKMRQKAFRFLAYRGYTPGQIYAALGGYRDCEE